MAIMATPKCNEGPKRCVPSPYRWYYVIFVLELVASRHVEVFVGSCALLHVDQAHIVAQAQREVLVEVNARTQAQTEVEATEIEVVEHGFAIGLAKKPHSEVWTHFVVELGVLADNVAITSVDRDFEIVGIVNGFALVVFELTALERNQRSHIAVNGIFWGKELEVF